MKIKYKDIRISPSRRAIIDRCNTIVVEYQRQGLDLTLRQLYYQLVARDILPNKQSEYKRLGETVADARLAGLLDWDAIEDRTRNLRGLSHWRDPAEIISAVSDSFRLDQWQTQRYRVEVWVEKQALEGVIAQICNSLDVPYFCCRGYTSISEMWGAGVRLARWRKAGQVPVILHLGDHDPSGIDMSRDIEDRLAMFMGEGPRFTRIALNMKQIEEYTPPPNPAKTTDSRYASYRKEYGDESWELDALEPSTLRDLITYHVNLYRDQRKTTAVIEQEEVGKALLSKASDRWTDVVEFLKQDEGGEA